MINPNNTIFDVNLPQLNKVLDESFMRDLFQNNLDGQAQISRCEIIGKRYKPSKRCVITYALSFDKPGKQEILYTRIENIRNAEKKHGRLKSSGAQLLPDLGMHVWRFPIDPKLKSLTELMNPQKLQKILANELNFNLQDQSISIKPFNYVPRRHCAFVVTIDNFRKEPVKVFGKIYGNDRGARVHSVMKQLWQQQTTAEQKIFGVAEPLAYDGKRKILWQRWSKGISFLWLAQNRGLEHSCYFVAKGLAGLHQSKLDSLPHYTPWDNYVKLLERSKLISNYYRAFDKRIQTLLSQIRHLKPLWQHSKLTTIHGDFNPSQILFDFEKAVFIDFDSASLGDPLYDVAHFVAGLHLLADQKHFSEADIRAAITYFCDLYKKSMPWPISDKALNGQIAVALVSRRAYKALRQLEENTIEKVNHYLELAEAYITR